MDHSALLFGQNTLSAIASASTSAVNSVNSSAIAQRSSQKRKRNRAILSCRPCHERKQQCDRAQPCARCLTRGLGEDCIYFDQSNKTPKTGTDKDELSTDGPVAPQAENVVQHTLRDIEPTALAGLEALLQLVQASNVVSGAASSTDRSFMSDQAVQVAASALGQLSQQGPGTTSATGPMAEIIHQIRVGHSQHPSSGLVPLADLRTHFPNHAITGHLLYHFFEHSSIPWLWSILHKPIFDTCYVTFSSGPQPPSIDFIALLAMVCACSLQFLPETSADSALFHDYGPGRDVLRQRLIEFSRSVLLYSASASPSLERIQAQILLAVYHLNEGNLTGYDQSSAISIRMAQSLSMNLDASLSWKSSPIDAEIRRRVWWALFILDRFQCLMLCRPYIIHELHCDVMMPHNLDQTELQELANFQSKPLVHPTENTFQIIQIQWAKLLGKIWDTCFSTSPPAYNALFSLEGEIKSYEAGLPPAFGSERSQAALDRPYILFQKHIVTLQICHVRALLLRPILFVPTVQEPAAGRDEKLANFHSHAKYVCIMFCKRLLAWQVLVQIELNQNQLCWAEFVVRIFDVAMTLAVAIITDPTHEQNEELEEWIVIAQSLLRHMESLNAIASKAANSLGIVLRHTNATRQPRPDNPGRIAPPVVINQYMQKATQITTQPQPSMSDLFDLQSIAEFLWREKVAAYPGNFPGIELLCSGIDITMERFLDNCIPTQF